MTAEAQKAQQGGRKLSPAERIMFFTNATRQNLKRRPSITVAPGATAEFEVPKVRLSAGIQVLVEATLTATHASGTAVTPATFAPYSLVNMVKVEANNGFDPWKLTGIGLYLANLLEYNATHVVSTVSGRGRTVMGLTSSSGGTANVVRFLMDLPLTLNQRDPIGLLMTQNQQTTVNVSIEFGLVATIAPAASGFTFALGNITVTPLVESFAIPPVAEAIPDLSILKLVREGNENLTANTEKVIKFPVGQTYRKIILLLDDGATPPVGLTDAQVTSDFAMLFNQSDNPYQIPARILAARNHRSYGIALPQGVWSIDLTDQGFPNFGGNRDYIDTERLSEFWVSFTPSVAGRVKYIYETLSRLR